MPRGMKPDWFSGSIADMKVLFLDIDGVLWTGNHAQRPRDEGYRDDDYSEFEIGRAHV